MTYRTWRWCMLLACGVTMAAEIATAPVPANRTIESLPAFAWWALVGWSFAGWVSASLKPAVMAMHDASQVRAVAAAGVIGTLVASMAFGIAFGLWLLCEATWEGKPLAGLYGYLGALAGGFSGVKGLEFAVEILKLGAGQWVRGRAPAPDTTTDGKGP